MANAIATMILNKRRSRESDGGTGKYTVVYNAPQRHADLDGRRGGPHARPARSASHARRPARSCIRIRRVGIEELLAVDLVVGDRLLAGRRDDPVDELLAELALDVRVFLGIDQHHAVLIEQTPVAFDEHREIGPILEREPGAAIREDVGAHRSGGVERRSHALAGVAIPRTLRSTEVDSGGSPQFKLGDVRTAPV